MSNVSFSPEPQDGDRVPDSVHDGSDGTFATMFGSVICLFLMWFGVNITRHLSAQVGGSLIVIAAIVGIAGIVIAIRKGQCPQIAVSAVIAFAIVGGCIGGILGP